MVPEVVGRAVGTAVGRTVVGDEVGSSVDGDDVGETESRVKMFSIIMSN